LLRKYIFLLFYGEIVILPFEIFSSYNLADKSGIALKVCFIKKIKNFIEK
jgi:hypothetical protein